MGVDFKPVAEAALAMAHVLLPEWMGGKRQGHEWVGERKSNGGIGDSWSVNLNTGAWGHFGGPEKGGDLVSLYAALNHLNQGAALEQVAERVGVTDRNVPVLPRSAPKEDYHPEPIPLSTPDIPGQPTAVYRYGTAFAVARRDTPSGKSFKQWTWFDGHWRGKAHPDPKPIYNLSGLAKSPDAPVLIVEGEKCADAAARVLVGHVVVTWAGGSNAVSKNDWAPLAGRKVLIWPDADEAGGHAGAELVTRLLPIAAEVRILNPDDHADGWDAADAIAEGWDAGRIAAWAKDRVRTVDAPIVANKTKKSKGNGAHPSPKVTPPASSDDPGIEVSTVQSGEQSGSAFVSWSSLGLDTNEGGLPHATLANASQILQMHPQFKGKIWFDSFRGKVYHTLRGGPKLWTDADTRAITARVQQQLKLPKLTLSLIQEAVQHAAECHARNSLTDWLDSLEWDGVPRLETWLSDCLGVEHNAYSQAIALNWPIAMVARAYQPGCKVDNMPVLEGTSGLSKTSFLEALGDPWYKSLPMAFGDKDFLQAIQGTWLVEIPDMAGFGRREINQIWATITIRNDSYRASYGRFVEDHPRVAMFAATSETDDYLQDMRARRRYWPLRCTAIDLECLRVQRDQIFAEALVRYRDGTRWYEMPAEADAEQRARATPDLWSEAVLNSADVAWTLQESTGINANITSSGLLAAIGVSLSQQTDTEKKRVARIMREANWIQSRTKDARYWVRLPQRTIR